MQYPLTATAKHIFIMTLCGISGGQNAKMVQLLSLILTTMTCLRKKIMGCFQRACFQGSKKYNLRVHFPALENATAPTIKT